jgi:DNA-binding MarR family transcriptional regulator
MAHRYEKQDENITSSQKKDGLDRFITYRLHVLNKIADRITNDLYERELKLTLSDCRCLAAIGYFKSISVNDLASHANLDKSQASRAAQRLVDGALVSRLHREGDGRIVDLVLTKSGEKIYGKVMKIATRRNQEVFDCLTDGQRMIFSDLLDKLIAASGTN